MSKDTTLQMRAIERGADRIVELTGEVDLHTSPELRELFQRVLAQGPRRVIVDLGGVPYMDSSGVGTLVELKRNVEREGGRLILAGLQPRVRSVLEITQLDKFFQIVANLAAVQGG